MDDARTLERFTVDYLRNLADGIESKALTVESVDVERDTLDASPMGGPQVHYATGDRLLRLRTKGHRT